MALITQSANAQKRYPNYEDPWDATDYRALVERVEGDGLELPTLAGNQEVFLRLVASDNIPLHMGQNPDLAITVRYQKLQPILKPLHQLIDMYSNGAQEGKNYASELARLMVYESKAAGALLEIGDPFLETLKMDPRYQTHVALHKQSQDNARDVYSSLVEKMADTDRYSKADILFMADGAINALPSYHPIFTDADRKKLTEMLAKQISATSDQEVKTALTELQDSIKNGRIRT
ncbi:MAG: hypothetical protein KTR19_07065 [Hyphomicrobiales bacterium]|nr:hypothetical protein [Hyphomicrobiales bacterium]